MTSLLVTRQLLVSSFKRVAGHTRARFTSGRFSSLTLKRGHSSGLFPLKHPAMEQKGTLPSSLPESPCPKNENPNCGDEELDEETLNFISALYTALGPLLPEVAKLQGHQDPPAHLMVDMKAKLRELGSSVSDAKKRLLQYNLYLKKRLAKAAQEKTALKEQPGEDISEQEFPSPESQRPKPAERVHRRSPRIQDSRLASMGEDSPRLLRDQPEEHTQAHTNPQGTQKSTYRIDTLSSRSSSDRSQL